MHGLSAQAGQVCRCAGSRLDLARSQHAAHGRSRGADGTRRRQAAGASTGGDPHDFRRRRGNTDDVPAPLQLLHHLARRLRQISEGGSAGQRLLVYGGGTAAVATAVVTARYARACLCFTRRLKPWPRAPTVSPRRAAPASPATAATAPPPT